jgi:hypothetical protein
MKKFILLGLALSFGFITLAQAENLQDYEDQAPAHNGPGVSSKNCTECDLNATNPLPESLLTQNTNVSDKARVADALGAPTGKGNNNEDSKETK